MTMSLKNIHLWIDTEIDPSKHSDAALDLAAIQASVSDEDIIDIIDTLRVKVIVDSVAEIEPALKRVRNVYGTL